MAMSGDEKLRWPLAKLMSDYWRGGIGVFVLVICASAAPLGSMWQWLLLVLASLFAAFLADTALRHTTYYSVNDNGLSRVHPIWGQTSATWGELKLLDLRYYSTRRDRKHGWMDARIETQRTTFAIDDRLQGFAGIVERVSAELNIRGRGISETTSENLSSLRHMQGAQS
jgi:hypothetical protein